MLVRRSVVSAGLAVLMVLTVASPGFAYGKETYQVTFSGTGTNPGTGTGLGFWGWCAFGGGTANSGTTGDCEFAEYVHAPAGSGFTCHVSLDLSQWNVGANGDFFFSGTATVNPGSGQVASCLTFAGLPGSSFSNVDSLIPALVGHHDFGNIFGTATGQFIETVKLIS